MGYWITQRAFLHHTPHINHPTPDHRFLLFSCLISHLTSIHPIQSVLSRYPPVFPLFHFPGAIIVSGRINQPRMWRIDACQLCSFLLSPLLHPSLLDFYLHPPSLQSSVQPLHSFCWKTTPTIDGSNQPFPTLSLSAAFLVLSFWTGKSGVWSEDILVPKTNEKRTKGKGKMNDRDKDFRQWYWR